MLRKCNIIALALLFLSTTYCCNNNTNSPDKTLIVRTWVEMKYKYDMQFDSTICTDTLIRINDSTIEFYSTNKPILQYLYKEDSIIIRHIIDSNVNLNNIFSFSINNENITAGVFSCFIDNSNIKIKPIDHPLSYIVFYNNKWGIISRTFSINADLNYFLKQMITIKGNIRDTIYLCR